MGIVFRRLLYLGEGDFAFGFKGWILRNGFRG